MKATMLARLRGMKMTYQQYLRSDHWARVKADYAASHLPRECLACGSPRYQLHHRTYTRLGCEALTDLIPLCGKCHVAVHEYEKTHPTHVKDTHKILRKIFGWTKGETARRFRPFRLPGRPNGFSLTPRR